MTDLDQAIRTAAAGTTAPYAAGQYLPGMSRPITQEEADALNAERPPMVLKGTS